MPKINEEAKNEFEEWKKDNQKENMFGFILMKAIQIWQTKSFDGVKWKKKETAEK